MPLFAEEIDDIGKIAFRGAGNNVGGGRSRLPNARVSGQLSTQATAQVNTQVKSGASEPITPRIIPRRGGSTTKPPSCMRAEPGRPKPYTRCSQRNVSGSHGISSQKRFGRL